MACSPGQKQAPLTATFQAHSARNADRDIQLPDGHIATRLLCCFPLAAYSTRTQTHIHLCGASHVNVQKLLLCARKHMLAGRVQ